MNTDLIERAIRLLDEFRADLEPVPGDEVVDDIFIRIGVVIAMLKGEYDPGSDSDGDDDEPGETTSHQE